MPIRSARRSATSRMWVVRMTVAPWRARSRQKVLHLAGDGGVEPGQRLVEDQELRIVDQGARERRLLLHAARKAFAAGVAVLPEAEPFEQFFGARISRGRGRNAPEAGDEFQIFERGQLVVEHRLVRQPGDDPLGRHRRGERVDAEDLDRARVRLDKARHHAQRRGLAGAVGAEQGVELAGPDGEVESVHGGPVEALAQAGETKRGGRGRRAGDRVHRGSRTPAPGASARTVQRRCRKLAGRTR